MNLNFINNRFTTLDKKNDRYLLIAIVFFYSVLFVNIFQPWNIGRWYSDSGLIKFLRLSSYGLVIALVFLFTQFPLRRLFKIQTFKVKTYLLWLIIEIALICFVYIIMYGNPIGNFTYDLGYALRHTVPGIMIPYSFAILAIHYKNHRSQIKQLENKIAQPAEKKLIAFKDDNNKIKFSVKSEDVLLIESTDNYVSVFYLSDGKTERELLRNTMKNLELLLEGSPILRCHRSYMINSENIEFVKKAGKKHILKVRSIDKNIPVSEKYSSLFLDFLS